MSNIDDLINELYPAKRSATQATPDIAGAAAGADKFSHSFDDDSPRAGAAPNSAAPKSNAGYVAYKGAMRLAKQTGSAMPPKHILNAPTSMMKDQGYGTGYAYDHDAEDGFSGQNYFPDDVPRPDLYQPVERGFERDLKKRLEYFEKLRVKRNGG